MKKGKANKTKFLATFPFVKSICPNNLFTRHNDNKIKSHYQMRFVNKLPIRVIMDDFFEKKHIIITR